MALMLFRPAKLTEPGPCLLKLLEFADWSQARDQLPLPHALAIMDESHEQDTADDVYEAISDDEERLRDWNDARVGRPPRPTIGKGGKGGKSHPKGGKGGKKGKGNRR